MQARRVNAKNFFAELKRRNVYKVAIAYAVVAWLLMQIASQIFPFFEIPNWAVRLVVLLLIFGFPVALILGWAFALTPEGIKRTESCAAESACRATGLTSRCSQPLTGAMTSSQHAYEVRLRRRSSRRRSDFRFLLQGPAGPDRQKAPPCRPPDAQLSAPASHLPTPRATG